MINERIKSLRKLMQNHNIDAYIIPSEDFHQSEYVGEYFKSRAFISGFTGSAGLVVVTKENSYLWTDGRYFTQAKIELKNSEVQLQKMGEKNVPTVYEFLKEYLKKESTLAFDGRCVSVASGKAYEKIVNDKNGKLIYNLDLISEIWIDRPSMSKEKAFFLEEKYTGESSTSKIKRIRDFMQSNKASIHIISSLDDICWILNTRGQDVNFSPLLLSYLIISLDEVHLFTDDSKLDDKIMSNLNSIGAKVHPYNDIYEYTKNINCENYVLIDSARLNYAIYKNIPNNLKHLEKLNPSQSFKAIKNETELENIRKAHVKDAISWVKFMYWIKNNIQNLKIDEIDASDKLESFRKETEGYIFPSFSPISGYKSNGAIVHYRAKKESAAMLEPKGLYLSDTGGHWFEGTTDITRTLALGELTEEEKKHFTLVLKSHTNLAISKFLKGCSGYAIDIIARMPLWNEGLDYKHGTGHGVGYLLSVHEGPHGIRQQSTGSVNSSYPLELGMVVTNEPGLYIEGKYGIRIESELIVVKDKITEFGEFYKFETCTYVPIDLDAINVDLLNQEEKQFLNDYHKKVYDIVAPHLNDKEKIWLKKYTREI